jgi:hypothetical protein
VFQAARHMDEIMVANFMVFHDLVSDEPCDLWIADEFWDVDHFLFDNRELKRTAYAWLTDARTWRNPQMTQTGWRLLRLSRCAVNRGARSAERRERLLHGHQPGAGGRRERAG